MNDNSNDAEAIVTLRSMDGLTFQLTANAANLSTMVSNAGSRVVEIMNVNADTLGDVVNFLTHYDQDPMQDIPMPLNRNSFDEIVTQDWYRDFLNTKTRQQVYQLLKAANEMKIKPLHYLTFLKITFELTGMTVEEIRDILNLPLP